MLLVQNRGAPPSPLPDPEFWPFEQKWFFLFNRNLPAFIQTADGEAGYSGLFQAQSYYCHRLSSVCFVLERILTIIYNRVCKKNYLWAVHSDRFKKNGWSVTVCLRDSPTGCPTLFTVETVIVGSRQILARVRNIEQPLLFIFLF